jgi:hypothetical protein
MRCGLVQSKSVALLGGVVTTNRGGTENAGHTFRVFRVFRALRSSIWYP